MTAALVTMALLAGCGANNTSTASGRTDTETMTEVSESSQESTGQTDADQTDTNQADMGQENTDVLQYYDIPPSYDIPDGTPEMVTSEKAREVYYSAGRIMIFYKDAVNSNLLDSWGNKRVTIGIMQ